MDQYVACYFQQNSSSINNSPDLSLAQSDYIGQSMDQVRVYSSTILSNR